MARVTWKGSISFGLVHIPVRLYTAVRDKSVRFHLLTQDGSCRLRRKLVCPDTGEEFDLSRTARGVEVAPDQYVLVQQEEIQRLRPERGHVIEIEDFVSLSDIDPVYYARPYYVGPGEGGARPYRLLVEALRSSGRVGIARFVMRQRQHLAALRVSGDGLVLSTMHYHDEVQAQREAVGDLPDVSVPVDERQLDLAVHLIESLSRPFEPDRYHDAYREQLEALIEEKAAGRPIELPPPAERMAEVIDLTEALKRSVQEAERRGA